MSNNPYLEQKCDAECKECPASNPSVNLLLGLLPLSCLIVQIPLTNILAPLVAWLCVRKDNPASKPSFRGVMNMQISWTIYGLILFIPCFVIFVFLFNHSIQSNMVIPFWGIMIVPIVCGIMWLVMTILFAVKVKRDVNAKPPLSIRFLK